MDLQLKAWLLGSWGFFWHQYWFVYDICPMSTIWYDIICHIWHSRHMSYVIRRPWHMSKWLSKEVSGMNFIKSFVYWKFDFRIVNQWGKLWKSIRLSIIAYIMRSWSGVIFWWCMCKTGHPNMHDPKGIPEYNLF